MRWKVSLALVSLGAVLSLAVPAWATVSEALSLRELVREADHVVLATVVDDHARRDARERIVTDYTVRVEDVMKGDARSGHTLVMTSLGGAIGDLGMRVEGEPHLTVGARYVLFLRRMGTALRPVGMSQGVLPVRDDGEPIVLPGGGGLSLVQRVEGGRLVPAPAALLHPEPYDRLRQRVGAVVADEPRGTVRP
jgi:hypothetical protein